MSIVRIVLATGNPHKLREVREIMGTHFDIVGTDTLEGYYEPEETGLTFTENAEIKALAASARTTDWVLADDSGLEVDALDGEPGVHSARYAGAQGDHEANIRLLLQNLEGVPASKRTARFCCVLALAKNGNVRLHCKGKVGGRIAFEPGGKNGFGYDPVFVPDGFSKTFAELDSATKHSMSHRGRALEAFAIQFPSILRLPASDLKSDRNGSMK